MDDYRRWAALRVCEYHRRGIFGIEETCKRIVFGCIEPALVAEYMKLLPEELCTAIGDWVRSLPMSDQAWAQYDGVGMLDGDEKSWAQFVAECRAACEAVRHYFGAESKPERA